MKELSIEEKAKAYDEALERAKEWRNAPNADKIPTFANRIIEEIFPEFKESEDERIRKEMLNVFKQLGEDTTICGRNYDYAKWIAWLEKQDTPKDYNSIDHFGKPIETESKFKVGDWIFSPQYGIAHIIGIVINDANVFLLEYLDGNQEYTPIEYINSTFDKWTIKDAKDGDVLASEDKDKIFLYNGKLDLRGRVCAYGGIYKTCDGLRFTKCAIGNYFTDKEPHPATKKQRDLLFQKMREEGWEFDFEKKELKKIEQKHADKPEPKFKIGDWVIDKQGIVHKIVNVIEIVAFNTYGYDIDGGYFNDNTEGVRLWTIKDAKDGDVLVCVDDKAPFIFKGLLDRNRPDCPVAYCGINDENEFIVSSGIYWWDDCKVEPATKEQRDTLIQAMSDAGWEFDFEKKELKKIEETFNGEDYGINGLYHAKRILEKTLGKVDGYKSDDGILEHKCAITAIKKLYEQKPAWNEDDEKFFKTALWHISYSISNGESTDIHCDTTEWLKSLKDRIGWKPTKKQLSELHCLISGCSCDIDEIIKLEKELNEL